MISFCLSDASVGGWGWGVGGRWAAGEGGRRGSEGRGVAADRSRSGSIVLTAGAPYPLSPLSRTLSLLHPLLFPLPGLSPLPPTPSPPPTSCLSPHFPQGAVFAFSTHSSCVPLALSVTLLVLTCSVGHIAGFGLQCWSHCWFWLAVSVAMLVLACSVGHIAGFDLQCRSHYWFCLVVSVTLLVLAGSVGHIAGFDW